MDKTQCLYAHHISGFEQDLRDSREAWFACGFALDENGKRNTNVLTGKEIGARVYGARTPALRYVYAQAFDAIGADNE